MSGSSSDSEGSSSLLPKKRKKYAQKYKVEWEKLQQFRGCIAKSSKVDAFFDLIQIQAATAQAMYDHIVKAFGDWNVPYKENMIGFAADGANVYI
ncbi:hypothetical protein HPB52_021872 [Rhipicephalus sanguineus]|uniref:Uncharacterized protein n=1 Tax=Rhipicephalus sanguineus TaxID=34632 RepID=A0A9D4SPR0_RHISA|nr:hypothetical protein HPB52_021872 [Rhipicephalus sanguineus]